MSVNRTDAKIIRRAVRLGLGAQIDYLSRGRTARSLNKQSKDIRLRARMYRAIIRNARHLPGYPNKYSWL